MIKGQQQVLGGFLDVKIDYLGKQRCCANYKNTKRNKQAPQIQLQHLCVYFGIYHETEFFFPTPEY